MMVATATATAAATAMAFAAPRRNNRIASTTTSRRPFPSLLFWLLSLSPFMIQVVSANCNQVSGPCTRANILANGCTLVQSFSDDQIHDFCEAAAFPFVEISDKYYQFDQNYMDGGSSYNYHHHNRTLLEQAGRVERFRSNFVGQRKVAWPHYTALQSSTNGGAMRQFNLTHSCQLQTAMCCFTQTNRDDDDDDNRQQYNSQVCHHDLATSRTSSHLYSGFASYGSPSSSSNNNNAYCVGFSWRDNPTINDYKGNLLVDISYHTLLDTGRTTNIPGAPLCGCVEHMPTITHAACRTLTVSNEGYSVSTDLNGGLRIVQTSAAINYQNCNNNDLVLATTTPNSPQRNTLRQRHIVGNSNGCASTTSNFLNRRFLAPEASSSSSSSSSSVYDEPDATKWMKMMGQGMDYIPHKGNITQRDIEFRHQFAASPNQLVYRRCPSCHPLYRHIYYKRKTPLPSLSSNGGGGGGASSWNFINLLMNDWTNVHNVLGVDFDLYSSYDDALTETNPWTYCAYNSRNVGFPNRCGPTGESSCQHNSHVVGTSHSSCPVYDASTHAFYIELP